MVPRSIPTSRSVFKVTQILEQLFSNLTSDQVSKWYHFSLEIFNLSSLQLQNAWLRLTQQLIQSADTTFFRGPINHRISHGIDNKLNETQCTTCHLVCKDWPMVQCHQSSLKLDLDPIFLSLGIFFPRYDQLSFTPTQQY